MSEEEISYTGETRKTVNIEAFRIEAPEAVRVSGIITLNIHCFKTTSGTNSQLKITDGDTDNVFSVSGGAVLNFTAENQLKTPFTNARSLSVSGSTITVSGGTFTCDRGSDKTTRTTIQNDENRGSLIIVKAFLSARTKNEITITGSTFEVGTWEGEGDSRTFTGGIATLRGTITVTESIFRAGNVANGGKITFSRKAGYTGTIETEVGMFTNSGGSESEAGLKVNSGITLTATGLENAQSKLVDVSGTLEIKNGETYANISNSGEIKVSGAGAKLFAGSMNMSDTSNSGTGRGVLTVTNGAEAHFSGLLGLNRGSDYRKITVTGGAALYAKKIVITESTASGETDKNNKGGVIVVDADSLVEVTGTEVSDMITGGTVNVITKNSSSESILVDDSYLVVYGKIDAGVMISIDGGPATAYSDAEGMKVGGYTLITQGGKGIWLTTETQDVLYVSSAYSATGENDGHGYGYNAFSSFIDALTVAEAVGSSSIQIVNMETAETLLTDKFYTFNNNLTISGSEVKLNASSNLDLCMTPAENKTITINSDFVYSGSAGMWPNYNSVSPNGSVTINRTISARKVGFKDTAVIGQDARINAANFVVKGTSTDEDVVSVTGKASHTGTNYQIDAVGNKDTGLLGAILLMGGKLNTTGTNIRGTYLTYEDDAWGFLQKDFILNSDSTTWTIVQDLKVIFYQDPVEGKSGVFNFTNGSVLNVKGNVINVPKETTDGQDSGDTLDSGAITLNLDHSTLTVGTYDGDDLISGGAITNTGSINVTDSTVSAASLDNTNGTPSESSDDGTFTVSGTSELHISSLTGTIQTAENVETTLKDSSITGGAINAQGNLKFTNTGTTNTLNGVTINAEGKTITNNGALTIDAATSITADTVSTGTNIITVSSSGVDWRTLENETGYVGFRKVIDVGTTDRTLNIGEGGNVKLADGAPTGVHLFQLDEIDDVYITNEDNSTVYVGTGYATVGNVVDGHLVGYNAFSTIEAATASAGASEIVVQNGTYEDITELNGGKTTIGEETGKTTRFKRGIYGGIRTTTASSDPIPRNIDLTITGGTFEKLIAGGDLVNLESGDTEYYVSGAVQTVSIENGYFKNTVAAGDRLQKGDLHRAGNVSMEISGGTFTSHVAGGMMNIIGNEDSDSHVTIEGNVEMKITGGTFSDTSWLYGGGVSSGKSTISSRSTITGSVTITVDAADVANDGIVLSHVAVGSHGYGHIDGEGQLFGTKIVFLGDGDNDGKAVVFAKDGDEKIVGELWGSSTGDSISSITKQPILQGDDAIVKGDRVLSFTGFNGQLDCANIRAFSKIEFKKRTKDGNGDPLASTIDSAVTLDNENFNLSGVDTWEFDCGSTLSGNFTNNFAGDTLNLVGFEFGEQTLMTESNTSDNTPETGERDMFKGFSSLNIQLNGDSVTITDRSDTYLAWDAGSISLVNGTGENTGKRFMVLNLA